MAAEPHYPSIVQREATPGQTASTSPAHLPHVQSRQTSRVKPEVAFGQTTRQRNLRAAFAAALLVAPVVAIPPVTRTLVDHAASALADVATNKLDDALAWRIVAAPTIDVPAEPAPDAAQVIAESASSEPARSSSRTNSPAKAPRGIVVRADTVARAVHSGGRPSGVFAPATSTRPAGLALVGVSSYGTALRDGDIVTNVGGTPATSVGAVIGAVAGAISHGAKVITGVVWRGDQRIDVAVEIPGPTELSRTKPRRRTSVTK